MTGTRPRFLVIRLSSIGDIVHVLPAVSALGETFPEAEIDWVVERRFAELLEGNRFLHRLVVLDTLGWRRRLTRAQTLRDVIQSIRALRQSEYDVAADFQGLWKSALIARLAHSQRRVGFAAYWLREPGAAIFYTERVAPRERRHVIEWNLALVEHLGAQPGRWHFPLPSRPEDESYVENKLARLGTSEFIIINPGGGWPAKCWAPENYAALIRQLEAAIPLKVLLTGSPAEEPAIEGILRQAAARQATYFPSTLLQYVSLVRRARLFVGGDTGPLHLAAAVGTPIVAIYGPTDPGRNGPFSSSDIVLANRGPIHYTRRAPKASFIAGISVESVLAAIHERLRKAYG
jgi:lipopolysaccharide heptosyltransferase I